MAEPSSSTAMTTTSSSSSLSSPSSSSLRGARELQGPRPAPLRVRRDSHKIRKQQAPPPPVQQVRQPVIIYTVSPKVVHAEPSEFRSVVQRLTGAAPSSLPAAPAGGDTARHQQQQSLPSSFFPSSFPLAPAPASAPHQLQLPFQLHHQHHHQHAGPREPIPLSPAARNVVTVAAVGADNDVVEGLPPLPSILSPVPGSLPAAVPPGFFSPPTGHAGGGGINLFGELISPAAFLGATPTTTTTTTGASAISQFYPTVPSPSGAYYWDLFNHHQSL